MNTRRVRFDIQYDGTEFSGWQIQPDLRTVQGELADALKTISGVAIGITGSGRTDAGVHARGQVAHADVPVEIELHRISEGVNALTGPDIAVTAVTEVPESFHARFSARRRTYVYRIARHPLALERNYVWYCRSRLDVDRMIEAAPHFVGTYPATAFSSQRANNADALVRVEFAELQRVPYGVAFEIRADRFVMHMVRTIVGTLVEIGQGKQSADGIPELIQSRNRSLAGQTAPACGLCLERVEYEDDGIATR